MCSVVSFPEEHLVKWEDTPW